MADRVVRVTTRSWRERLGGSIRGVLFGILLVGAGAVLLFWNEGRAVKTAKGLREGASSVVSVDAGRPQNANEGKLVHFSGEAWSEETLRDPVFGVEAEALKLERKVEMFQWQEKAESEERKKLGGGTETVTTYTYVKDWSSRPVDSSSFEEPQGHRNPDFRYQQREEVAEPVTIGDWRLGGVFISKLGGAKQVSVGEAERLSAADSVRNDLRLHQGGFFLGDNPGSPDVGDYRIRFYAVPHQTVSVIGLQQAGELVAYPTSTGTRIALLRTGVAAPEVMFEAAQAANTRTLWIFRVIGFMLVMFGFKIILAPLSVAADVMPMIGNLVERGTGWISFMLAALVSLVTVAIGWIYYRPLLGIFLLVLAALVIYWIVKRMRTGSQGGGAATPPSSSAGTRPSAPPPPPPPPPPAAG